MPWLTAVTSTAPRWREADLSIYARGGRQDSASLLDDGMLTLPAQISMHAGTERRIITSATEYFGGDRYQHMHMVGHQVPFFDLAFLALGELAQYKCPGAA
jgi:hypothetical protein